MNPLPHLTLTAAERKALKARAHHLNPVVTIGDAGLSAAVIAEAERAIVVHELIKVRVLGDDRALRTEMMGRLCDAIGAAPVQMIGKLLVLWRPKPPAEPRDSGPHLPKKIAGSGGRAPSAAGAKARPARGRAAPAKPERARSGPGGAKPARTRSSEDGPRTDWKRSPRAAPKRDDADRGAADGRTGRRRSSGGPTNALGSGGRGETTGRSAGRSGERSVGGRTAQPRRPSTRPGAPAAKRASPGPRGRKR